MRIGWCPRIRLPGSSAVVPALAAVTGMVAFAALDKLDPNNPDLSHEEMAIQRELFNNMVLTCAASAALFLAALFKPDAHK